MLPSLNANDSSISIQSNTSLPKRSKILMTKLEKLKVSSKRGRPKKKKDNSMVINKYFKIPERYKLMLVVDRGLTCKDLEAVLILKTGENMGLLPIQDRDKSLEVIKRRL